MLQQLTVDLIKEAMLTQQDAKGFILVGFPKNPRMSNIFNKQVKWPEKIVALEVDNEVSFVEFLQWRTIRTVKAISAVFDERDEG